MLRVATMPAFDPSAILSSLRCSQYDTPVAVGLPPTPPEIRQATPSPALDARSGDFEHIAHYEHGAPPSQGSVRIEHEHDQTSREYGPAQHSHQTKVLADGLAAEQQKNRFLQGEVERLINDHAQKQRAADALISSLKNRIAELEQQVHELQLGPKSFSGNIVFKSELASTESAEDPIIEWNDVVEPEAHSFKPSHRSHGHDSWAPSNHVARGQRPSKVQQGMNTPSGDAPVGVPLAQAPQGASRLLSGTFSSQQKKSSGEEKYMSTDLHEYLRDGKGSRSSDSKPAFVSGAPPVGARSHRFGKHNRALHIPKPSNGETPELTLDISHVI